MITKRRFPALSFGKYLGIFIAGIAISVFFAYAGTTIIGTDLSNVQSAVFSSLGIGKTPSAPYKLDVNGKINATEICISEDCKTTWPSGLGTETDPIRSATSGNYVKQSQTGNRNTAYSRGNHATAGYLTSSIISSLTTSSLPYRNSSKFIPSSLTYSGNNLGIGTSNPNAALDISGTLQVVGVTTLKNTLSSKSIYFASGSVAMGNGNATGDAVISMSGGRLTVMYRSGGVRNVSSYLTP